MISICQKKYLFYVPETLVEVSFAEALINAELEGIDAESSGVKVSGRVNPNAKKLLKEKGIWKAMKPLNRPMN